MGVRLAFAAGGVLLALGAAAHGIAGCGIDVTGSGPADGSSTVAPSSTSGGLDAAGDTGVSVSGGGDAAPDASPIASLCATACPAPHGSCASEVCTITCNAGDNCNPTCPPGLACKIVCDGLGSCATVTCATGALSCDVTCTGDSKCGSITCSAATCNIACTGADACAGSITENGTGTITCADNACTGDDPLCNNRSCGCHCSGHTLTCNPTSCTCPESCN
jgi:hypothetical protein